MSEPVNPDRALGVARQALQLVCANLPHLSGLAHRVRLTIDDRFPVAAITASGKLIVNSQVFCAIPLPVATYVMAHELLHLALDTHNRGHGSDHETVNYAHDYIINDMLREELLMDPPLSGLDWSGARHNSLEQVIAWMRSGERVSQETRCWNPAVSLADAPSRTGGALSQALQDAGLVPEAHVQPADPDLRLSRSLERCDVVTLDVEHELFPDELRASAEELGELRREGARAASLGTLRRETLGPKLRGADPGGDEQMMAAIRGYYRTPWEVALQRWMESVAPGQRTYVRPSRRGADRTDVVLPGRYREGWTMHLVLDTSGSMWSELPRILGAIATFCENVGVTDVHILQTDVAVHVDEFVAVEELENYRVAGFGGSDMSPGMNRLNEYPEVTAAIVLTDGHIAYPDEEPGYRVVWAVTREESFSPPYGEVIYLGAG